jgi:putative peptide zinc metalloprotease protein
MEFSVVGQLPHLRADVQVSPFADRSSSIPKFLVQVGSSSFVINGEMRDLIEALKAQPATLAELAEEFRARSGKTTNIETLRTVLQTRLSPDLFQNQPKQHFATPFVVSGQIFSGRLARQITKRFTWLFSWPIVAVAMSAFAVVEYLIFAVSFKTVAANSSLYGFLLLYAAVAVGGLIHEIGHLTACARNGAEHGGVGVGLYLVFPAFYADVTSAWKLPRWARVSVDFGGLYFQSIFLTVVGLFAVFTKSMAFYQINFFTLVLMLFTLNPALRFDGYWLLVDLSGVHNLAARRSAMVRGMFRMKNRDSANAALDADTKALVAVYTGLAFLFTVLLVGLTAAATYRIAVQYPGKVAQAAKAFSTELSNGKGFKSLTAIGTLGTDSFWLASVAAYLFDLTKRSIHYASNQPS